ncbi:nuclear transport factor 2 family protein [Spirosoma agri]|uniref:Nuclear transport factor 2 family protein n=1 Tax=Spirosoma agri TaxID=1987381 RepID=A0A6M0IT79_9BACT|nr:nuclear transport factor 2 family protein [Spirosoma agri]NEU70383.1 nuclear transport factor 2 family protein [Spirosoma agri]
MISHPNIELVHRFFQAYATNDLSTIETILSPIIQWHIPGRHPLSGVKKGIDDVLTYFEQLGKADFQASPIVMGVNDQYVIDCHQNWSQLQGVDNLNAMSCLLWKIDDGKISEVYNFPQDQYVVDAFISKLYA